jgi:hypothetical protein
MRFFNQNFVGYMATKFCLKSLKGTKHFQDPGIDGRMDLRNIGWKGADWIDTAPHRDKWRAFVNTVMKFRVM